MKRFCLCLFLLLALAGGVAVRAGLPETVRVGLTRDFANRETIPISTARIHVGYETNGTFEAVRLLESAVGFVARVNAAHQVVLYAGNTAVFTFDRECHEPQLAHADGGFMQLGTHTYRGRIALRAENRRITAVNIVCPEEYLFSVIAAEMFPSWHLEAFKAQAVAARTFTYRRAMEGRHAAAGFHLCDTTCCQVYRGVGNERDTMSEGVLATRGTMIFFEDAPILAVFHSSSGGATDNSENVWVEARPYLRSVNSINEFNPREWIRSFTWAELTAMVNAAGANIGTVNGVAVTDVAASGRVQALTLFGTAGQHVVTGDRVRSFFAPALDSRNFRVLEALPQLPAVSVFDGRQSVSNTLASFLALDGRGFATPLHMAYVFDGTTTRRIAAGTTAVTGGSGVTLIGAGWGHGVGMSQHGAQGMALMGFTYRDILHHYYTGVEIR